MADDVLGVIVTQNLGPRALLAFCRVSLGWDRPGLRCWRRSFATAPSCHRVRATILDLLHPVFVIASSASSTSSSSNQSSSSSSSLRVRFLGVTSSVAMAVRLRCARAFFIQQPTTVREETHIPPLTHSLPHRPPRCQRVRQAPWRLPARRSRRRRGFPRARPSLASPLWASTCAWPRSTLGRS